MPPTPLLLLASASPRRREILRTLGLPFEAAAVEADEAELPSEAPEPYLVRVVDEKLRLAEPLRAARGLGAVLVADTTVVLEGRMLAKPRDEDDNRAMVSALAGKRHHVFTRFAARSAEGQIRARTVVTAVSVRDLSGDEVRRYVASGEGRDKAGGYAIQGLGSFAVTGIEGSYSNVVGLPACEVVLALRELGVLGAFPFAAP